MDEYMMNIWWIYNKYIMNIWWEYELVMNGGAIIIINNNFLI